MAMAATLTDAANISYSQCNILWTATTLRAKFLSFIVASRLIFEDATPNDRPVGNWLVLMTALQTEMGAGVLPVAQLDTCATYLFRMCLAAVSQRANNLITNAQAVAFLAAWNANIGT